MTGRCRPAEASAWSLVPPALDLPVPVVRIASPAPAAPVAQHVSPWLQRAHAQRGGSIDELVATLQAVDTHMRSAGHKHAADTEPASPKRAAPCDD